MSVLVLALGMILGAGASASALVDPLRTPSPGHGGMGHGVPFAPSIQAMAITPDEVVYAGSFGMGVFRSSDKGQSWTMINHGLTDLFVLCLAVHPNGDVYAGTVRGGVYRLVHGTTAWESIKTGLKRVEVKSLLIGDRGIYAGTGRGVYRWDEADHQWTMVHQALDQFLIPSMAMLNDRILLAATAGKGLFTVDTVDTKQSTWLRGSSGLVDPKERLPHRYLRIVVVNERQQIFLGTQDGGLFMSTDEGRSWHPISRTLPNDSIRGIVSQDSALYVATGLGVYVLGREDRRWQPINSGLTELSIQTFVMSPAGVLYVGTSQGAFRSDDNGKHWVNVSEGFGLHTYQPRPY